MSDVDQSSTANAETAGFKRRRAGKGAASSPVLLLYIGALVLCAVALVAFGWEAQPVPPDVEAVVVLCVLGILGASLRERSLGPRIGISIGSVILAAAIPLVGPAGATMVGFISHLLDLNGRTWVVRSFNAAMTGVLGGVGGLTYLVIGGRAPTETAPASDLLLWVALPLAVAYAVIAVLNTVLLGVVMSMTSGAALGGFVARTLQNISPSYFGYGLIGFLFVVLWEPEGLGAFSAVLILAPLLVAQWTFTQYGEERRAHERTVATLVATVEASNPYTRGHSERVAKLCSLMAHGLRVKAQETEVLSLAAVLHDVGTVATPIQALRKEGPLQVEDLTAIAGHPQTGVAMLKDISFLSDALPGILYHHERFDGRGYPFGIGGTDIPLYARMIAVADAFDSLTTTRSYRPAMSPQEALENIESRGGTQFDPEVVRVLQQALEHEPWSPTVLDSEIRADVGFYHDHDDPIVSDLFAEWVPADHEVDR